MEDVQAWLEREKLGQYADQFNAQGYDSLSIIQDADAEEVAELIKDSGMKKGHAGQFRRALARLQQQNSEQQREGVAADAGGGCDALTYPFPLPHADGDDADGDAPKGGGGYGGPDAGDGGDAAEDLPPAYEGYPADEYAAEEPPLHPAAGGAAARVIKSALAAAEASRGDDPRDRGSHDQQDDGDGGGGGEGAGAVALHASFGAGSRAGGMEARIVAFIDRNMFTAKEEAALLKLDPEVAERVIASDILKPSVKNPTAVFYSRIDREKQELLQLARGAPPSALPPLPAAKRRRGDGPAPCRHFFRKGYCKFGAACRDSHTAGDVAEAGRAQAHTVGAASGAAAAAAGGNDWVPDFSNWRREPGGRREPPQRHRDLHGGPRRADLESRVASVRRSGAEANLEWKAFCKEHGGGSFDMKLHPDAFLRRALEVIHGGQLRLPLTPDEEGMLDGWVDAKRRRDFARSDALQAELRELGVNPADHRPDPRGGKGGRRAEAPPPAPLAREMLPPKEVARRWCGQHGIREHTGVDAIVTAPGVVSQWAMSYVPQLLNAQTRNPTGVLLKELGRGGQMVERWKAALEDGRHDEALRLREKLSGMGLEVHDSWVQPGAGSGGRGGGGGGGWKAGQVRL